jgi:hypothetical protein
MLFLRKSRECPRHRQYLNVTVERQDGGNRLTVEEPNLDERQEKGQEPFWLTRQFGFGILLVCRRPNDATTTTRRRCR